MASMRAAGAALALTFVWISPAGSAAADEGGVSFWLPGQFGSLAAAPAKPGWSLGAIYYRTDVDGGGEVAASRLATIGGFDRTVNIDLDVALTARPDVFFAFPTYTFASPVLGGQLGVGAGVGGGRSEAVIDGTLTLSVGDQVVVRQGSIDDERWGFADIYPQVTLRWNRGVHNFMTYAMGDIPVGTYDADRLANIGIGHGAIDAGAGYTYFNPRSGLEFSAVTGFTYNFENPDTDYQNGIDWHLDWGVSRFLTPKLFVGAVGYFYEQLTADEGAPLILGDNKSRVIGIGPQIGRLFPLGGAQGFLGVKGYGEFDAENRADGWNVWLTFAISPGGH